MITVPRDQMPQIDEKDIPRLLVFLGDLGTAFEAGTIRTTLLKPHQDVNWEKARALADNEEQLAKPVILSADLGIVDGNHRVAAHLLADRDFVPYIMLRKISFEHAIPLLNAFPASYSTGQVKKERE